MLYWEHSLHRPALAAMHRMASSCWRFLPAPHLNRQLLGLEGRSAAHSCGDIALRVGVALLGVDGVPGIVLPLAYGKIADLNHTVVFPLTLGSLCRPWKVATVAWVA